MGIAADAAEEKPQSAKVEAGAKEKETSLYLYYQKYLNPYLNKGKTKGSDKDKITEPKGTLVSNPSPPASVVVLNRTKPPGSSAVQDGSSSEAKEIESEEKSYIALNKLDSIGLDAINRTFPQEYRKEYLAELALGFKLSPFLDLSVGKVQRFERSGESPWGAHDDGWRIRLQKNF